MLQHKQTGFTLIEGLITVLVISFGFLAIARLQINIWRSHLDSMQRTEAIELGFEKLNEQRQLASISLPALASGHDRVTAALTHYDRAWKNSQRPVAGQQNQVNITWGLATDQHSLLLQTVIGQNNSRENGIWISRFE